LQSGRVLRFLTYAESPYEAPDRGIELLEKRGLRGHVVLVEALHVGSASLRARLTHGNFKDVAPVSVKISVVANLVLTPGVVYLLPRSTVALKLSQIKRGEYNLLPLPSTQYHFQIADPNVGALDTDMGVVTALDYGSTDILLRYSLVLFFSFCFFIFFSLFK
jgi:hypothetical protein